jgi:hypothetical protein
MIQTMDIQVSFRTMHRGRPTAIIAYDSQREKFTHVQKVWPHLYVSGSTPEGLCYEAIMDKLLMSANHAQDKYFLNYSDGYPGCGTDGGHYGGQAAVTHTAHQVRKIRNNGIEVLSYFITNDPGYEGSWESGSESFKEMYGNDSEFISVTSVPEVAKSLNRKFLKT